MFLNARQIYTPLTIGSFLVASITGVLMFIEVGPGSVRATHEWISMLFVIAGLLHIYTNRQSFVRYLSDKPLLIIAASIAVGGMLFILSFGDVYLAEASYQLLTTIEIGQLLPLLDISHEELLSRISELGIMTVNPEQSLYDVAQLNDIDVHEIMERLIER